MNRKLRNTNKALNFTEYRCKLMNKILFARSQDEVCRYINAAIKGLKAHQVNGHLITRFIEKVTQDLREFSPLNADGQQWSNIKMAQMQFNRLKGE